MNPIKVANQVANQVVTQFNTRNGTVSLTEQDQQILRSQGVDLNDIEDLDDFLDQGEASLNHIRNETNRMEVEMANGQVTQERVVQQEPPKSTYSKKDVEPEVVTPRKEEPQAEPKKGRGKSKSPISTVIEPSVETNTVRIRAINPVEFITIVVCSAAVFHMLGSLKGIPLDLRTTIIRFVLVIPSVFALFCALTPYGHKQRQLFLLAAILIGLAAGYFFLQVQAVS
jgi:hypothetical protein